MRYWSMRLGDMRLGQRVVALVAIALLTFSLASCAKPIQPTELISEPTIQPNRLIGQIAEVSPPDTLEALKQIIDAYTPQVRILSPRPGEILNDTTATVRLQVRGLPLFKNDTWQLGPHLHLFLDGEPYQAIYDPAEPITFEGLSPGTHTLRVFASRPWHESFKNQGAFDQRTFHVYAQTPQNEVNAKTPLLTYSRPQGTYGAEPIMLDFYLTNAPLHMSAQTDTSDDLHDWRIRCTVNDQSFVFDQWQPIWLKGFKPGRNWVQLELIDEGGNPIDNRFNNTVRAIDYQPGGTDTLARLVRGELTVQDVVGIIDPTYLPPVPEPEPEPTAAESDSPAAEKSPQTEPRVEQPSQSEPFTAPTDRAPKAPLGLDQPEQDPLPNPFLLPQPSPDAAAEPKAPIAPDAEKTLIEEIQAILDEATAEETPPIAEPPAAPQATIDSGAPIPDELAQPLPNSPKSSSKALLDRFKQWRDQVTPPPEANDPGDRLADPSPAPATPDLFAAPESSATPAPTIEAFPEEPADRPRVDPDEPTSPQLDADTTQPEAKDAPELPRIESSPPAPRSPLTPEVRPFI